MFICCSHGYNLLLHGFGSKYNLMEEFLKSVLKDFTHVVINGYFPSLSVKSVCLSSVYFNMNGRIHYFTTSTMQLGIENHDKQGCSPSKEVGSTWGNRVTCARMAFSTLRV